ncbi:unnamed protein product [Amoebophrya sp. A120]|nr:unnamed protein product [Amoebophrya sp. A120]|eukprot:GSA120T00006554001.1
MATSSTYWAAGASTKLDEILMKAKQDCDLMEQKAEEHRAVLNAALFAFHAEIGRVKKDRRGFEDLCIKIELELDNANEQLSLLDREDAKIQYREDRKQLLRITERLIARESEEKQKWEQMLQFLQTNFDLSPATLAAAASTASSAPFKNHLEEQSARPKLSHGGTTTGGLAATPTDGHNGGATSRQPLHSGAADDMNNASRTGFSSLFTSVSDAANRAGSMLSETLYGGPSVTGSGDGRSNVNLPAGGGGNGSSRPASTTSSSAASSTKGHQHATRPRLQEERQINGGQQHGSSFSNPTSTSRANNVEKLRSLGGGGGGPTSAGSMNSTTFTSASSPNDSGSAYPPLFGSATASRNAASVPEYGSHHTSTREQQEQNVGPASASAFDNRNANVRGGFNPLRMTPPSSSGSGTSATNRRLAALEADVVGILSEDQNLKSSAVGAFHHSRAGDQHLLQQEANLDERFVRKCEEFRDAVLSHRPRPGGSGGAAQQLYPGDGGESLALNRRNWQNLLLPQLERSVDQMRNQRKEMAVRGGAKPEVLQRVDAQLDRRQQLQRTLRSLLLA